MMRDDDWLIAIIGPMHPVKTASVAYRDPDGTWHETRDYTWDEIRRIRRRIVRMSRAWREIQLRMWRRKG
jgi:hypothetical protein